MVMCFLTLSLAALAHSGGGDTMKQDSMKQDDMAKDKKASKTKTKTKTDKTKQNDMKKDDTMKQDESMKRNRFASHPKVTGRWPGKFSRPIPW
jgi:pentapeptide MXKDX repeat protein